MADEEKHNVIMGLKQQYDEQGAKLRQVRAAAAAACSSLPPAAAVCRRTGVPPHTLPCCSWSSRRG